MLSCLSTETEDFFRDIPFRMKLSLGEVSHHSAPRCVFFAVVETEERDTPPSRFISVQE